MRIDNQALRLFSGSMARCLASGLPLTKSLELSGSRSPSKALQEVVQMAIERCDQGMPVSEAFAVGPNHFPHYVLPVIRAGELTGRLVEAFQLISQYCQRIDPSVRLVRNTWLYPLVCILFGWSIRIGIFVYFGKYHAAWLFFWSSFGMGALVVAAGWFLFQQPSVRRAVDQFLLQMPLIRETELQLATVLFFTTFRLGYAAGGLGVVRMFDLACETVRNEAIRADLLKARPILAEHGTFGEAFAAPEWLEDDFKNAINTGSISGQLEQSFAWIVEQSTLELEQTLDIFNRIFQRLVAFSVSMSIVETVLICIM